jgi:hypothetical protein
MPPLLSLFLDTCGSWTIEATELRNIPDPPLAITRDTNQVESGIAMIDTVEGTIANNFKLTLVTSGTFPVDPFYNRFYYKWSVVDMLKSARVEYYVRDFTGNVVYDTLVYAAPVFVDTMPPITILKSMGKVLWDFDAREFRNVPSISIACPRTGDQSESGLTQTRLDASSSNLSLNNILGLKFPPDSMISRAIFTIHVIDTTISAFGILNTMDRAGNTTYDTLRYEHPTSVNDIGAMSPSVAIAPNPTTEQCRVTWSPELHVRSLDVVDLNGRAVLFQKVVGNALEAILDVRPLPKGSYAVRLKGQTETITQRFVVR